VAPAAEGEAAAGSVGKARGQAKGNSNKSSPKISRKKKGSKQPQPSRISDLTNNEGEEESTTATEREDEDGGTSSDDDEGNSGGLTHSNINRKNKADEDNGSNTDREDGSKIADNPRKKRPRSSSLSSSRGSSISTSSSMSSSPASRTISFSNSPTVSKAAQQAGTIKMSCTSPGCVNLVIQTHAGAQPQFFEMQLSNLMDELLTADTATYGDITFDLRKVISFISKNLTG